MHLDPVAKRARVLLKGSQVIPVLRGREDTGEPVSPVSSACWNYEGGEFHVEAIPGRNSL